MIACFLGRVSAWRALENASAGRGRNEHLPHASKATGRSGFLPAYTSCAKRRQAGENGEQKGRPRRNGHTFWMASAGLGASLTTLAFRHSLSSVETMPRNLDMQEASLYHG